MRRCSRRRGCPAMSSSSCSRSAPCRSAAVRTALPDHAADGEGTRQARQPGDSRHAGRARPLGAGEAGRTSGTPAAQRARSRHRKPRGAAASAGKAETGEIALTVRQQGNEIAIEIADDGAGLDFARIREKARAQGLIAGDAEPTEARLTECIFAPGFSTAAKVTQISGRGVGADVVRSDVAALGGRVDVATVAAREPPFHSTCPLTLAVAQTVLVRAGGRLWALPAPMVEQVQQIKDKDLINLYLTARGHVAEPEVPVLLPAAPARQRRLQSGDAALQLGPAVKERPEHDRRARRRDDRQSGSRREEHRSATWPASRASPARRCWVPAKSS